MNALRAGRALLRACVIACHPWEYWLRRREARRLVRVAAPIPIDRIAGFSRFGISDFEGLSSVIRLATHIYEERKPQLGLVRASMRKREYMEEILSDDDLRRYPEFVRFCLSIPVVNAVSRYLGTVPVLRRVGLLLSSPAADDEGGRLYHLDPEDFRQVKLFVNVFGVTPDHGPLTWLPGPVSRTVLKRVSRRWDDDELTSLAGASDREELLGPSGTGAFVDTSRCLYFGSRIKPGATRLVFYAQYLRYHFAYPTDRNRINLSRRPDDPLVARLLTPRPGRTPYANL